MGKHSDQPPKLKIRTLKRDGDPKPKPQTRAARRSYTLPALGVAIAAILFTLAGYQPKSAPAPHVDLASVQDKLALNVREKIQDSLFKERLLRRRRLIENIESQAGGSQVAASTLQPLDDRSLGLQFDVDNTSDRLYKDLHPVVSFNDNLPDDKINARLANRKWLNEEERAERVQFVRNFIRSAYDKGYQVELDSNLVVTGVKKIDRKVSIDQVLEKLGKQGL